MKWNGIERSPERPAPEPPALTACRADGGYGSGDGDSGISVLPVDAPVAFLSVPSARQPVKAVPLRGGCFKVTPAFGSGRSWNIIWLCVMGDLDQMCEKLLT